MEIVFGVVADERVGHLDGELRIGAIEADFNQAGVPDEFHLKPRLELADQSSRRRGCGARELLFTAKVGRGKIWVLRQAELLDGPPGEIIAVQHFDLRPQKRLVAGETPVEIIEGLDLGRLSLDFDTSRGLVDWPHLERGDGDQYC